DSGLLVVISASWRSPNPADRGIDATVDRVDDHPQAAPRLAGGMRGAACATRGAGRGMHHATCGTRHAACTTRHAARGTWHAPTDDRPHSVQIHCISCIQTAFWDIASRTMPSETRSIRERPDASAKCTPPRHRKRWRGGREDPSAPPTQSAPGSRERSAVHRLHVHGTHVQRAHVDRAERAAALVAEGRDRGIVVATLDHGTEVTGLLRVVAVV